MKKATKKQWILSLGTAVLAVSLAGCGGKEQTSEPSGAGTKEASASEDGETIVLKWYTDTDEIANKTLYKTDEIAAEFMKQNPHVKIEIQPLVAATDTTSYLQKVDLMLASEEQLDIIYFSGGNQAAQKIASDSIIPLNDLAAERGIDLAEEYTNSLAFDGKYYTLAREDSPYITFINKDMLEEAGLPIPPLDWTWEDYREYARVLTKGEGPDKVYGSYFHTWDTLYQIGYFPDTLFYKEDGSSNFDNPAFKDFLKLRYEMEQEGISTPMAEIKSQNIAYREMFFNGKAAMMPQGTWLCGDIKDLEKYPHDFETTFAALPRLTKDQTPNATLGSGGSGYAIAKSCKHPEEAFDFIYFLTTWGADYNKSRISAWSKSDLEGTAKAVMGEDESLYDFEAFEQVMNSLYQIQLSQFPEYNAEVMQIFSEECEMGMTGVQTIDKTIENLISRSNEVINSYR